MQLARVVGRLVSTVKQDALAGITLQWIQPLSADLSAAAAGWQSIA